MNIEELKAIINKDCYDKGVDYLNSGFDNLFKVVQSIDYELIEEIEPDDRGNYGAYKIKWLGVGGEMTLHIFYSILVNLFKMELTVYFDNILSFKVQYNDTIFYLSIYK